MKTKSIYAVALMALTVSFFACQTKNDPENNGNTNTENKTNQQVSIVLSDEEITLKQGETKQLTASVTPEGTTVTWSSLNTAIATVDANGLVTAGKQDGATRIIAKAGDQQAACKVTVGAGASFNNTYDFPECSEVYPFVLDATTAEKLGDKLIADFRPDDVTKFLYIWHPDGQPESVLVYEVATASNDNFYGTEIGGYTAMTCGQWGWAGAGWNVPMADVKTLVDNILAEPDKYFMHVGIYSTDNYSNCFYILGLESTKFVLGKGTKGAKSVYDGPVYGDYPRDGKWYEFNIPMSDYAAALADFDATKPDVNVFVTLTEGTQGAQLNIDACYIYKK